MGCWIPCTSTAQCYSRLNHRELKIFSSLWLNLPGACRAGNTMDQDCPKSKETSSHSERGLIDFELFAYPYGSLGVPVVPKVILHW